MGSVRLVLIAAVVAACGIPTATREQPQQYVPECGNTVIDPDEVCDDGNTEGGDGCSADCKSDEKCGNHVIDEGSEEACDDGNNRDGDGCSADCKSDEKCGNKHTDKGAGETCDDGNTISGDGCNSTCQSNEKCGNGTVDTAAGEQCDGSGKATATCDLDCTLPVCGDGTRNTAAGEECDDNNTKSGDGCDGHCRLEDCGNNRVEDNEQCDDGNSDTTDGCVFCRAAFCGDTYTRSGVEQCDDGNTDESDDCLNDCTYASCGDGRVHSGFEECDDANNDDSDDCVNCFAAYCGDGYFHSGFENCDDGNNSDGDGCDANCNIEPKVYFISFDQLINMPYDCGGGHLFTCGGGAFGFSWNDSSGFQPRAITVEVDMGVNCLAFVEDAPAFAQLNGVDAGGYNFDQVDQGTYCSCSPPEVGYGLDVDANAVANYVVNGTNMFMITVPATQTIDLPSSGACMGLSTNLLGGYARVTVFP